MEFPTMRRPLMVDHAAFFDADFGFVQKAWRAAFLHKCPAPAATFMRTDLVLKVDAGIGTSWAGWKSRFMSGL